MEHAEKNANRKGDQMKTGNLAVAEIIRMDTPCPFIAGEEAGSYDCLACQAFEFCTKKYLACMAMAGLTKREKWGL